MKQRGTPKLSRVMGELDAMRDELRNIALGIGRSYNTLHNYYDHCLGVFDKEGWYAFTDTLASNLLLIVGSAGLNTWAAGARGAALTPGQLPQALRHPLKYAETQFYNARAGGLTLGPGEHGVGGKLTGWNNPNAARGTTRAARPADGVTMHANDALDRATSFLGEGYREIASGVFRSADGTRQVRMTASDLARSRNHAGAPHFNFEEGRLVTRPNGRQTFRVNPGGNSHVFIDPEDL